MRRALPLLLLLAACADGPRAVAPPSPSGPTARFEPASGTQIARLVDVVVTGDLRVTSVRLRGAGFAQVPAQPATGTAATGAPLRLTVAYGPVLCAGRAAPTALELGTPGGEVVVPVEADDVLPGLRAAECAPR